MNSIQQQVKKYLNFIVRSTGMGVVFGFGNIGGYVSPFIANFS